jgi:hypothetical protein
MPSSAAKAELRPGETLSIQQFEGLRDEMRVAFDHLRTEFERLEEVMMAIQIKQRGETTPEDDARNSRLGYICWTRRSRSRAKSKGRCRGESDRRSERPETHLGLISHSRFDGPLGSHLVTGVELDDDFPSRDHDAGGRLGMQREVLDPVTLVEDGASDALRSLEVDRHLGGRPDDELEPFGSWDHVRPHGQASVLGARVENEIGPRQVREREAPVLSHRGAVRAAEPDGGHSSTDRPPILIHDDSGHGPAHRLRSRRRGGLLLPCGTLRSLMDMKMESAGRQRPEQDKRKNLFHGDLTTAA